MTTLSSFRPSSSAITLDCGSFTTATVAVVPTWASDSPAAKLVPTIGMLIAGETEPAGGAAVMFVSVTLRSGVLPWLKRITAAAPAAWAFATLRAKLHPPRWISAIRPATKPAKSLTPPGSAVSGAPTAASVNAPSHPLVFARGGVRLMSMGVTWSVTVPRALPVTPPDSCVAAAGVSCWIGCATVKSNSWVVDRPAGRLERLDHVVDARVVPGCAGGAVAAVCIRDRLERGLVLADALERHAPEQLVVGVVGPVLTPHRRCCGDAGCGQEQSGKHAGGCSEEDAGRAAAHSCRVIVHVDSLPPRGAEAA